MPEVRAKWAEDRQNLPRGDDFEFCLEKGSVFLPIHVWSGADLQCQGVKTRPDVCWWLLAQECSNSGPFNYLFFLLPVISCWSEGTLLVLSPVKGIPSSTSLVSKKPGVWALEG
jgi:hypothetical protein